MPLPPARTVRDDLPPTADRCPTCDREGCPALRGATWLIEACACGGFDCYLCRNQHDCEAHRVDWRARALAADADAARWRKVAPLIEAMRKADASLDRDEMSAAVGELLAEMEPTP